MFTDLAGKPIAEGDWMVQAYNLGRCAAVKFCRVTDTTGKTLRVRGVSRTWRSSLEVSKPYSIKFSGRSFIVHEEQVPIEVRELYEKEIPK